MNVFLQELRSNRNSIVVWSLSMAGFASLYMLLYGGIQGDFKAFEQILGNLPAAMRAALGIVIGTLNTIAGFYSFMFIYVVLCGGIQAMNYGVAAIGKEVGGKTADFLLTKPVARSKVLVAKTLSVLASLVLTNVIYLAITVPVAMSQQPGGDLTSFVLLSITLFFVQLMFAAMGLFIGVAAKKIKSVVSVTLPTVFAFFIVGMLGSALGVQTVRYITPFKYFDTTYILEHQAYEATYAIVAAIFVVVAVVGSFLVFARKDIHAA